MTIRDIDQAAVEGARGRLEGSLGHARDRGKIDAAEYEEILARITYTDRLEDIASLQGGPDEQRA